jgi:Transcriptional regulators containing a DNA-binding HTH domain and an aminotransferase domain (MocR family) and their eukaryotic orthologs
MEYNFSQKMTELKPSAIREIFKSLGQPGSIAFSAGNPAPESFPVEFIEQTAADILAHDSRLALQYSVTEGYTPLREAVAARLRDKFSTGGDGDMTLIVSGGQQGIELTAKVMCNEGDTIIAEDPSFIGALNAFRSLGCRLAGVPLEEDGMDLNALEAALKANPNAKLIYTIPNFHNPAGVTASLEKRKGIYALAKKYGVLILEDNPYGELRFEGDDIPTIKSMDTDGIVVYCGSFSKILSAGIRVGFVCAPEPVATKIVVAKQVEDVHTNIFFQLIAHRFMTQFDMDSHIAGIRALYKHKCGLMLDTMTSELPDDVRWTKPQGGLFLWCTLPNRLPVGKFVADAAAHKVFVVPGSAFLCDQSQPTSSVRLNYSTPSDDDIVRGIKILGEIAR